MTEAAALARAEARIVRLEEVLAEYVLSYGLTDRAPTAAEGAVRRRTGRRDPGAERPLPAAGEEALGAAVRSR